MRPPVELRVGELSDVRVYEDLSLSSVIESQVENCQQQNDLSSFLICDVGDIVKKHKQWTSLLPNVMPTYVVGCNDDSTVLKTLGKLGTRFSCANKIEIQKVLDAGVDGSRIEFSNPMKQASHIKYSGKVGVRLVAFDSEVELKKIKAQSPKAELVLQVAAGLVEQSSSDWVRGCRLKSVASLLRTARSLGLTVTGVSAVLGRREEEEEGGVAGPVLEKAIEIMRNVCEIAWAEDVTLKFIDLGNVTVDWSPERCNFAEIGRSLQSLLSTDLPAVGGVVSGGGIGSGVELRAQVDRYLVSQSVTLLTTVVAKRPLAPSSVYEGGEGLDGERAVWSYYLNDGVYGVFSRLLSDKISLTPSLYKMEDFKGLQSHSSSLMGPTCDDLDCIVPFCSLPELSVGDWLIFKNMGGVSAARSSQSDVCYYVIEECQWDALDQTTVAADLIHCLCGSAMSGFTVCPAHFYVPATQSRDHDKPEEWLDI